MAPTLPSEIYDQICEELYAELWVYHPSKYRDSYKPVALHDIRGARPIGNWVVPWRTLRNLRLASHVMNEAASRFYFRRLEVALWTPSGTPVRNLQEISSSPYASHVEELKFIQWPNAEDGDEEDEHKDPHLAAFCDYNRDTLTNACRKFTRLRELTTDESGYYTTYSANLKKIYPFWSTILDACPPSLSHLSYHWPGTPDIFLDDHYYSDEDVPTVAESEDGVWQNRRESEQVKKLHLTLGQYCVTVTEPFVKIPESFGIHNLQELCVTYLWWLPTFWLPTEFLDLTTLSGFALSMADSNYVDVPAKTLSRMLTQNKDSLRWIRLELLVLRDSTWAEVLSILKDAPVLRDVNLAKLMIMHDDRSSRKEVCQSAKTSGGRSWVDSRGVHPREDSDDLKVIGALLHNAERNARALQAP